MAPEHPYDPNSPHVAGSRAPAIQDGPTRPVPVFGASLADRLIAYLERLARTESSVRQLRVAYSDRFPETVPARRPDSTRERTSDPERGRDR